MVNERALLWPCQGEQLVAVLSEPSSPVGDLGVLVVVGGPQYRAGSHRQFVQLARAVAAAGHVALRFDVRGMGDSTGELRNFEAIQDDITCAVNGLLAAAPRVRRVVLMGLCDGASAALMYLRATQDPRVAGLCLLNPWVRSEATLARAHAKHYYLQRLRQGEFWRKLLRGGVGTAALGGFARALRSLVQGPPQARSDSGPVDFRVAMLQGCQAFTGPVLLCLSEEDLTAREFADTLAAQPAWGKVAERQAFHTIHLAGADHTLSQAASRLNFEEAFVQWACSLPDGHPHCPTAIHRPGFRSSSC